MKTNVWLLISGLLFAMFTAGPVSATPWDDALAAYQNGDFDRALELLVPLGEAEHMEAQDILSDMYVFGEGVPIDYVAALGWSRRSAALGSAEGENGVGTSYSLGQGVTQDKAEALKWYFKAPSHGNGKALASLARRFLYGEDVKKDEPLGLKYLQAAADNGRAAAQMVLAVFTRDGSFGIAADPEKARLLFARAAETRCAPAQVHLASMYELGIGGPRDRVRAMMWISLAASRGCIRALEIKAVLNMSLTEQQLKAARQLTVAWDAGHPPLDRREHDISQKSEECRSITADAMPSAI